MATIEYDQIQKRRGTAALWSAANPLLAQGEQGLETDTNLTKTGDGVTYWNSLPYEIGGAKTATQLNAILAGTNAIVVTANQAVAAFNEYFVNTLTTAITLTMPASANVGDYLTVYDSTNNAASKNITLNSNGLAINGSVQNAVIDQNAGRLVFKYEGSTYGWKVTP